MPYEFARGAGGLAIIRLNLHQGFGFVRGAG